MPPSPQSSSGTEGTVLLVEEYDALAAAIASALKKYGPRHAIRVSDSLRAAENVADETAPDLVVIDFDPPLAGALGFFSRLKTVIPEAGVLIIAADVPREILRERTQPSAFQFIEKPFQLAEFGEAILALLGHADQARALGSRGTLRDLSLGDIIPLLCMEGANQILSVISPGKRGGEIHFVRGQIRHAAAAGVQGMEALREMFGWALPNFAAAKGDAEALRSVEGSWPTILQEMLRTVPPPHPVTVPKKTRHSPAEQKRAGKRKAQVLRDGKKILVIEDTETLRIFVEEMLSTHDPSFQIFTASDATEGLRQSASIFPDLILLDYSLPDFNGDEVCRRLLENEATRQIPIIMMSGHVAEMAATAAQYENVVLTVPKPFLSAALLAAVTTTLSKPPKLKGAVPVLEPSPASPPPATEPEPAIPAPEKKLIGQSSGVVPRPKPPLPFTPRISPSDKPVPPSEPAVETAPVISTPSPLSLTPTRISNASGDAVVVSISLEVVSMQFSPDLRITAIRARPSSSAVSLRVDPRALPVAHLPEAAFEVVRVTVDGRGQLQTMQVAPATPRQIPLEASASIGIERLAVLPSNGNGAIQLIPAPGLRLLIHLLVAFDLVGVELSHTFGVAHLGLRARGGRMRVILPHGSGKSGVTFETAQVALDHSARIAEILVDSVVRENPLSSSVRSSYES